MFFRHKHSPRFGTKKIILPSFFLKKKLHMLFFHVFFPRVWQAIVTNGADKIILRSPAGYVKYNCIKDLMLIKRIQVINYFHLNALLKQCCKLLSDAKDLIPSSYTGYKLFLA
ncbi:hypothetical protein BY996DRAFT_943808 [Phakopsora pachyrhizi]|nr:hypothetical protein BY996DRAFT_943808 [Phakopsora pachyrhizi]